MKEWCIQHPWMTFFTLNFMSYFFFNNNFVVLRGNKKFMENLSIKGVKKMSDKSGNETKKGNDSSKSSERRSIYENSNTVKPSSSPAPKPPGKQK